jgi:hypothetical protein
MKICTKIPYFGYTIYGPYTAKDNRQRIVIRRNLKNITVSYPKFLMECKLGRLLRPNEEIDHINENTLDNRLSNLQILTKKQNRQKEILSRFGPKIKVNCINCNKVIFASKSQFWGKRKFCSHKCVTKFYAANQYGNKLTGYKKLGL